MNSYQDGPEPAHPGLFGFAPQTTDQNVQQGGGRTTVMLAAFEGWNDAGDAASDALKHLHNLWGAAKAATLDPDEYYDFQFTRPSIQRSGGGKRIKWPSTSLTKASVPGTSIDVVFVHGVEPSYKWRAYTAELLAHATEMNVDYLILVGALLADVPHTRPIPVSASSEDDELQLRVDIEASHYEGPIGIVGVLSELAHLASLPTLSVWAAVPHYVAQSPSPKATLALLNRLEELLQIPLDTEDMAEDAEAWERGVDELATEDPEIAEYVKQLEEAKDTVDLPEASGESIAREFERYLKKRRKE